MSQEQIKEQLKSYFYNNLNEDEQKNVILEITSEYELQDQLKLIYNILCNINDNICYNITTSEEQKEYNTLTTIELQLKEILKNNNINV